MKNTWDLKVRLGWLIGLAILAGLLVLTATLLITAINRPVSIWTFLASIGALFSSTGAIYLVYKLWGLVSASYEMDRNAITIHWGPTHYQIPMASVRAVMPGTEATGLRMRPGIRWPGYVVGFGELEDGGSLLCYATAPLQQQVIIRTENMAYAISPTDLEEFLQALRERLEMGPTQEIEEKTSYPAFLDWEIWKDRFGLGVFLASIGLLVLLVGLLCWRYPHLPPEIIMRFNADGAPLLMASPSRIFYLALMGAIFLVINGGLGLVLYSRLRIAAYILWSGLLALQGGLWAAVISVLLKQ